MFELKNWHIDVGDSNSVFGLVYNNPNFIDGFEVKTSKVERIIGMKGYFAVYTENNVYRCYFSEYDRGFLNLVGKLIDWFDLPKRLGLIIIGATIDKKHKELSKMNHILDNNDVYIEMSGDSVNKAYIKTDNDIIRLNKSIHSDIRQDSILLSNKDTDIRYFPKGISISFYILSKNIRELVIKNVGHSIYLRSESSGDILIKSNNSIRIKRSNLVFDI